MIIDHFALISHGQRSSANNIPLFIKHILNFNLINFTKIINFKFIESNKYNFNFSNNSINYKIADLALNFMTTNIKVSLKHYES